MKHLLLIPLLLLGQTENETVREDLAPLFPNYTIEHRLWDGTRVDLLGGFAVEVDWATKWAEAIGQSLYYGLVSGRDPGIVLLMKKGEERYVYRCQTVCAAKDIRLWIWDVEKGKLK